ncbi:unnamed protein product [Macrosiphum euphorbiae]|uniref:Uncharacterized protein n=1 Tax=Macrosiphum euphorbiae TaxID=13131 RepID=A0AAV0VMS3_9HEMI|nr:unnamed protein product [Macrosiphum euphorbiae]
MNTDLKYIPPSDNPVNPANSPSAEAWTHGFWGGPSVFVNRPKLCSLADVPSGRTPTDAPSGQNLTKIANDPNLTIIDDLSARSTLRLKGGGDEEDKNGEFGSSFNTPTFQGKRRRLTEDDLSPDPSGSLSTHALSIEKYSDEASTLINDSRAILEDMVKEAKVARRWVSTIGLQLDEILVSNNRLTRTSYRVLGMWEEQRSELRAFQEHINDLHSDMGALKERYSQCQADRDSAKAELAALRASGSSAPPSAVNYVNQALTSTYRICRH